MDNCSKSAEQLRDEMRQVRLSVDEGVEKIAQNTRVLMDWRYYIRSAPWLSLGAAAVVGYFLIPSKTRYVRPDAGQIAEIVKHRHLVLTEPGEAKPKTSVTQSLAGVAGTFLLRTAVGLATEHFRKHGLSFGGLSRGARCRQGDEV
jgi:hypothetical protein